MPGLKWINALMACILMSCGATSHDGTSGAFRTPGPDGRISTNLVETQSAIVEDTIAIIAGRSEGVGLRAYAGIIPDQPLQNPVSGNASYAGPYTVAFIDEIVVENSYISGRNSLLNGTIALETDLSEMTVYGSDGILTVRARIIDNTHIEGEVEVLNVPGVLIGEVGADRAFGAFHGGDLTTLMSGGFVAARVP